MSSQPRYIALDFQVTNHDREVLTMGITKPPLLKRLRQADHIAYSPPYGRLSAHTSRQPANGSHCRRRRHPRVPGPGPGGGRERGHEVPRGALALLPGTKVTGWVYEVQRGKVRSWFGLRRLGAVVSASHGSGAAVECEICHINSLDRTREHTSLSFRRRADPVFVHI
ncbi:hypothetical protein BD311DRAFT_745066 [Dichomitus squalens]|uniref:Uncharacterized protein n=1 Tax=Dichomitus squalens TaxID=114155 RepID=A0A4Q9N2U1_9APHY|nr:hypothetical protein BD311DRAFT_745066 [Dichomitus squalens]